MFIIIPTLNESKNIEHLIKEIFSFVPEVKIIIVDDNSKDGTFLLASKMAENNKRIWPILRTNNKSFSGSYIEGIEKAISLNATKIIQMDADFSHSPRYLSEIIKALDYNDLVIGSRYVKDGGICGWGLKRKLMSRVGNLIARLSTDAPINDFTAGFLGWNNNMLKKVILKKTENNGYAFLVEMKYRAFKLNAKIEELPIIFEERVLGKSKMNKRIVVEFFVFCAKTFMKRILSL